MMCAPIGLVGDLLRSEAKRDALALVDLAAAWKAQFEAKGWTAK
jgi:hypothetical protein